MPSSSPRGQGGPEKSSTEVQLRILKKRPLQFSWIPCLCGGKHTTSICPTEQTTTTKNIITSCGGTNFKPRKGKRQYRVPSIGHRWTEFRWQAQRRKISVDMTERHYMTLIKTAVRILRKETTGHEIHELKLLIPLNCDSVATTSTASVSLVVYKAHTVFSRISH